VDIGGQVIVHAKLQRDLVVTLRFYSQGVSFCAKQLNLKTKIQKYQPKAIKVKNQKQKYKIKPKLHYKCRNIKHLTSNKSIKQTRTPTQKEITK
jgi:hypothetical protein